MTLALVLPIRYARNYNRAHLILRIRDHLYHSTGYDIVLAETVNGQPANTTVMANDNRTKLYTLKPQQQIQDVLYFSVPPEIKHVQFVLTPFVPGANYNQVSPLLLTMDVEVKGV